MRGRESARWLALLLLLAASGCESSDPTVLRSSRWGAEYAAAACARIFTCCDAAEIARWGYTDEAQCRQTGASDAQTNLDSLLSIGWISYDAKAARRCVDELAALPCGDLPVYGRGLIAPACATVSRGTGQIGRVCEDLDVVCESSNCEPSPGTCGPTRGCTTICGLSEYCDPTAQTCAPLKAEGASCASSAECVFALTCGSSGSCGKPLPGGAACAGASDCASDVCTAGSCDPKVCDGV